MCFYRFSIVKGDVKKAAQKALLVAMKMK